MEFVCLCLALPGSDVFFFFCLGLVFVTRAGVIGWLVGWLVGWLEKRKTRLLCASGHEKLQSQRPAALHRLRGPGADFLCMTHSPRRLGTRSEERAKNVLEFCLVAPSHRVP